MTKIYYDIFINDDCIAKEMPFTVADILIKGLLQTYPEDYTMEITLKMTEKCIEYLKSINNDNSENLSSKES